MSNSPLSVVAVPAFSDNYLWLIHNGSDAVIVDPGDAEPVLAALKQRSLTLRAILLTHHHADHVGGVPALLQHTSVPVFGPRGEAIPTITVPLSDGDRVEPPLPGLHLSVIDVPGHTSGHIAYVAAEQGWLFCGDTLFGGGCGRLFEGTPAQMLSSLQKLAALPETTQVFCAHEYTLSNLRFAQQADPDNPALAARIVREQAKRDNGQATIPSTIGLEKSTNPFLRSDDPAIRQSLTNTGRLQGNDAVAAFSALRGWKDTFK
ncbi:hydroxyacylglutathione hydrolase [Herbaspirillum sp. RTI4]|uniref:hydroxyacylglutathione hydrolase n=1 Tax=Herbaspirillum sp. RTI4 TaxID=3048640 RepID=UPI002AB4C3AD|nr:hydroxyacylglutathione hydrolase [Herbaspirillum sp. RTI4]MDY7579615.1 hydroxyacylglutathione hydrolase [Herbaspirillum sp. RTI4]MEA9983557.1 hydroxyacylglutathione hydrolase [Herbaspirillum sp. RTI4]